MKTTLINDKPYEIILSDEYVAFDEDDHRWEVWETKEFFTAGCFIGKIRFVLDKDDTVLAEALPMCYLSNGFDIVEKKTLEMWKRRIK